MILEQFIPMETQGRSPPHLSGTCTSFAQAKQQQHGCMGPPALPGRDQTLPCITSQGMREGVHGALSSADPNPGLMLCSARCGWPMPVPLHCSARKLKLRFWEAQPSELFTAPPWLTNCKMQPTSRQAPSAITQQINASSHPPSWSRRLCQHTSLI